MELGGRSRDSGENEDGMAATVDWEELDKTKFYTYSVVGFMGVRAILYPPFLIKTRLQVQPANSPTYTSSLDAVRKILKSEGPRGLYRGFWISALSLLFRQLYFSVYEVVRYELGPGSPLYEHLGPSSGEVVRNMLAGSTASMTMQMFTVPLDVVTQRMMVSGQDLNNISKQQELKGDLGREARQKISQAAMLGAQRASAADVAKEVYREGGLRGFYRGLGIAILQFAPTSALWWTCYNLYRAPMAGALERVGLGPDKRQVVSQGMAGFCAGATTVLCTNPLDVVRTRLQVEGRPNDNRTVRSEFRTLWQGEGMRGLFRGLGPRLVTVAPASFLILSVYEGVKRLAKKQPEELGAPS